MYESLRDYLYNARRVLNTGYVISHHGLIITNHRLSMGYLQHLYLPRRDAVISTDVVIHANISVGALISSAGS